MEDIFTMENTDKKILLVDDSEIQLYSTKKILEHYGYKVETAMSGEEALEKAKNKPDLIILDVHLPDIDGYEISSIIRKDKFINDIPIVNLSATYRSIENTEKGLDSGADSYLTHPVDPVILISTINSVIKLKDTQKKLKYERDKARVYFKEAALAIIILDKDNKPIDCNDRAVSILGEKLCNRNWNEVIKNFQLMNGSDDSWNRFLSVNFENMKLKTKFVNMNGEEKAYLWSVSKIKDTEDKILIGEDITEITDVQKRLERQFEQLIFSISKMLETRDPYTAKHQIRVSKLAFEIAKRMLVDKDRMESVRISALVHDIGKISIPAEILNKPLKLNELEMNIIKEHPVKAYEMLKDIDFPWPVDQIVRHHHEKMDGSGYPDGICAGELPLEVRILTVADVVDAMSSDRPYRPALGMKAALDEIKDKSGILFDPEVVKTCVEICENGFSFDD